MSTIASTTTTTIKPSTKKPTPVLTATYRNGLSSSTLSFTYPLSTPPDETPPFIIPQLKAKTAHLQQLRELCKKLQGDLNDVLTEMMREKNMKLGEQNQEEEEEQEDDGEEDGDEEKVWEPIFSNLLLIMVLMIIGDPWGGGEGGEGACG